MYFFVHIYIFFYIFISGIRIGSIRCSTYTRTKYIEMLLSDKKKSLTISVGVSAAYLHNHSFPSILTVELFFGHIPIKYKILKNTLKNQVISFGF